MLLAIDSNEGIDEYTRINTPIHLFVVWPLVGVFHFARQNRVCSARVSDLGPNGGRRQHGSHAGEWEALCLDPDWEPALGRLELVVGRICLLQ